MAVRKSAANPGNSAGVTERPLVTVDVAIFTVRDDSLQVLLVHRPSVAGEPYPGRPALPGGFVDIRRDTTLHDCALRKLKEKTGLAAPYLEQLGSWGGAKRDPRGWSATHAWFALVPPPADDEVDPAPAEAEWVDAEAALSRRLAFDHNEILAAALARLRAKVEYTSLPAFLLAEPFTLPQLQRIYEVVLGRELDKSAFRKRMLDADFLRETGAVSGASGRAAQGYRIADRSAPVYFPRPFKSGEQLA
ncbi:NUDIX hydrolase [Ramlibacter albus]|uniref:NUDIX hydrolase n=1 Tax=Ramlibacter albus TaxID=2079448 RepID=A0A923S239_9BURK|nr:NUDIX domain-containing protein [Ramlibacter albus]MBC5764960.1 NUDIX hydrolase [Ramlibacter albus]